MSARPAAGVRPGRGSHESGCLEQFELVAGLPRVCIRVVALSDAPLLGAMVSALSPASRYRRFHVGVGDPPADLLEALVRFDPATGIVLLATTREAGGDVAVGEARVVADESEPAAREFALAVVDAMQGRGLGTRLLRILIEYAESSGARRLYGDVLAENRPMLQLARKFGFVQRFHPNDPRLVRVQRDVDLQIRWSPRDQSRRGLDPVFN